MADPIQSAVVQDRDNVLPRAIKNDASVNQRRAGNLLSAQVPLVPRFARWFQVNRGVLSPAAHQECDLVSGAQLFSQLQLRDVILRRRLSRGTPPALTKVHNPGEQQP
jgi:hypothetical protein